MENDLLEKVNVIRPMLHAEPQGSADSKLYRQPDMKRSTWLPEELAWYYDHSDPATVPAGYRARFGQDGQPRSCRTAAQVAMDAGFPRIVAYTLEGINRLKPVPPQVLEWANGYHGAGTPWLWLNGGAGAGKTTAAAIACAHIGMRADMGETETASIAFCTARDMTELVDGSGNYRGSDGHATKHEVMESWTKAGILVLDDLGIERRTRTSWDTLNRVIDERCSQMLPTVITCQCSGSEWLERYRGIGIDPHETARLAGRIAQALKGWTNDGALLYRNVVSFTGEDMRLNGMN